jgi:ADP-heptose:LPS heptosyltransferase
MSRGAMSRDATDRRPVLLILRALGLGDFLTSVPALRALAEAFPEHRRILAAPAELTPLVRLAGAVETVLLARPLEDLQWAGPPPDVAVNLHGRGPESHRVLLRLSPGRLLAFSNPEVPESWGGPKWRAEEHEVTRWCRLLRESGLHADPTRLELRPPPGRGPQRAHGAVLIHPGAASPSRRWPAERWAEVARSEAAQGNRIIITAGPGEEGLAARVVAMAGLTESSVRVFRTTLEELAGLVARAGVVLCADTGVAHLATALGTPSVVLFGPTPPALWGPPPDHRRHRALWAGRTGDPHARVPDPGLLRIRPRDVVAAISGLRRSPAPSGAKEVS